MAPARSSRILRTILALIIVYLQTFPANAKYNGGNGTANDPYQIATAEHLILLCENPEDYDKHFILTADIDLNPSLPGCRIFDRAVIAPGTNDTRNDFQGQIHNCYCTGEVMGINRVGGFVGRNLGDIISSSYTGMVDGKYRIGGLVGNNDSGVTTCCYSTGTVSGLSTIGGLVGSNSDWSYVTDCYSTSAVSGGYNVGGLVGENMDWSRVTLCYSTGMVQGGDEVGGLVGFNGSHVTHCYSTSKVQGNDDIGGLVGSNRSRVQGSESRGDVGGENYVGGLVGYNRGDVAHCSSVSSVDGDSSIGGLIGINDDWSNVTCCYSTGTINGSNKIGGLVGANRGTTDNCYATGPTTGHGDIGGLVGHNNTGTITNCYSAGLIVGAVTTGGLVGSNSEGQTTHSFWDIQTSHRTTSAGGSGKSTDQMCTAGTFLRAGWDFVNEIENGTEDIWWILEEQDYPEFAWNFWAASPHPEDNATEVQQPLILTWVVGKYPRHHDVYFGEDEQAVANATTESKEVYRGQQPAGMTCFEPGPLKLSKTYYWRIDEVNEADPSSPWKGKVWCFTTADHILVLVVDDFERYTDNDTGDDINIWQVWIDGYHNGTGSQVSYFMPPYCEQTIVHGGHQSMPFFYDNDGKVGEGSKFERQALFYSEAMRAFELPWDWTINDADTLTLYFRGEADNDPDTLYVAVEDNTSRISVTAHPDANAILATEWQIWYVPLTDMQAAGVDLTSVLKIYIGVGDRDNPKPDGVGKIYIDDIWVTNRMP